MLFDKNHGLGVGNGDDESLRVASAHDDGRDSPKPGAILHLYRREQLIRDPKMFSISVSNARFQEYAKYDIIHNEESLTDYSDFLDSVWEKQKYRCLLRQGTIGNVLNEEYLNEKGLFVPVDECWKHLSDEFQLQARMRVLICLKKGIPPFPGLSLTREHFSGIESRLHLHPSTLQYTRRSMTASRYWIPGPIQGEDSLNIILSLPVAPQTHYDFISLTYNISSGITTAFIRECAEVEPTDFSARLLAIRERWAHPFCILLVMLDLHWREIEREVLVSDSEIAILEDVTSKLVEFGYTRHAQEDSRSMTDLMKDAQDAMKEAVKLFDAIQWMQRTLNLLYTTGQELHKNMEMRTTSKVSPLETDWLEIRQYLEDLSRLCQSVEPRPIMVEKRCRAQLDLLNGQIAQESNQLSASLAIATTRDSPAMKMLVLIAALFLPSIYVAVVFNISMFRFRGESSWVGTSGEAPNTAGVELPRFWVFWTITGGIALIILFVWRIWWVIQDRSFRRQLPGDGSTFVCHAQSQGILRSSFFRELFHIRSRQPRISHMVNTSPMPELTISPVPNNSAQSSVRSRMARVFSSSKSSCPSELP